MIKKIAFILFAWTMFLVCFILRKCIQFTGLKKSQTDVKKILIFTQFYPGNAGYHYRVKLWKDALTKEGFEVKCQELFSEKTFLRLTSKGNYLDFHFRAYLKRFFQLWSVFNYDCIIVRRSLLPYNDYGNLFLDKLLIAIHLNVILDFDDDLSNLQTESRPTSLFGKLLVENRLNFYKCLQLYSRFTPGSKYLNELVLKHNSSIESRKIHVLPTCVDYNKYEPKKYEHHSTKLILGWIGSNTNQAYLNDLIQDLNKVNQLSPISLTVISGKKFASDKAEFEITNQEWSIDNEVSLLKSIDIGLMPLPNNKRTQGKCAFKLIQYMGLGIVSVASSVGANNEVITEKIDGYLVSENESWYDIILYLAQNKQRFSEIGKIARKKIDEYYSFDSNKQYYFSFIRQLN